MRACLSCLNRSNSLGLRPVRRNTTPSGAGRAGSGGAGATGNAGTSGAGGHERQRRERRHGRHGRNDRRGGRRTGGSTAQAPAALRRVAVATGSAGSTAGIRRRRRRSRWRGRRRHRRLPAGGAAGRGGTTGSRGHRRRREPLPFSFYIGADVTEQEPQPAATRANLLTIMKAHGFNYIRLRTFVDPRAADGYDKQQRLGRHRSHRRVRQAGEGRGHGPADRLPLRQQLGRSRQAVRAAGLAGSHDDRRRWRPQVHDYTRDSINMLIAGGARPDMVQIGNESTPGILIHRCDSGGIPLAGRRRHQPGQRRALLLLRARSQSARGRAAGGRLDQPRPAA